MQATRLFFLLTALLLSHVSQAAEEFSFDVSAYQKKNYRIGGYLEYSFDHQDINQDAAASALQFISDAPPNTITQHTGIVEVSADYKKDKWQGYLNFHAEAYDNDLQHDQQGRLYEAVVAYQPNTGVTLETGKKAIKWGKGYAWNPVGFVERPKDPNDPDLSREGYVVATADVIKSFTGDVKTLAITPVYLPVTEDINEDYGLPEHNNVAVKLYLLYKDIDFDLMFLAEGSRSQRYGFDFAANITTNFEIHGEWASIDEVAQQVLSSTGTVSSKTDTISRWLLGLRYLTENDTTIIAEYYRNNGGYSDDELANYFTAVETAETTNNSALLNLLQSVGEQSYLTRNPGKEYLYLRLSNKEPFDWVYVFPAVTFISNLEDRSYSISPELIYSGYKDIELRFKATLLNGNAHSEFAEKRSEQKYELRMRYFF